MSSIEVSEQFPFPWPGEGFPEGIAQQHGIGLENNFKIDVHSQFEVCSPLQI